ncbi:MAG: prolyl oligopeptidase family serine peptidase, partial [Actinobacteria bacterium]|nr:prolyl oligopeptidase family serine peptidase [Actinomycetota bacterium]
MRVRAIVATVLLLVVSVASAPGAQAVDVTVPVPSGIAVPDNHVRVLLPADYDADPCRRYPVLYLLHGVGDSWQDWTTKSDLVEFSRQFPVIIVMPDGGNTPNAGWYSDWVDGSRQYEGFHLNTVLPWVDATYRTLGNGHRMIAGSSMGGFGAMSYAARHPGLFKVAAAFSGIVDTMYAYPASGPFFETLHERLGTPDDRVWGDQFADEEVWRAHNPTDLAAQLKGTNLFLYSGIGAPTGAAGDDPSKAPNYATEHLIFQANLSFTRALDAAGVPYRSDFHPGYHDWPYFEAGLHWALPQMMPLVGAPSGTCVAAKAVGGEATGAATAG